MGRRWWSTEETNAKAGTLKGRVVGKRRKVIKTPNALGSKNKMIAFKRREAFFPVIFRPKMN